LKVSVITTTYNQSKYIKKCIDSVIAQDYKNWEMLIIDDGSTDGTNKIVSEYVDPRIKYFPLDHTGIFHMGKKYNFALSKASGDIIAILEADDYYPPWKLSEQIKGFKDDEVVLSWGRLEIQNEEGEYINIINTVLGSYDKMDDTTTKKRLFTDGCFIPFLSVMIKKDVLTDIGGFYQYPNLHCLDYPTILKLVEKGKFLFVDSILGFWRWHSNNISQKFKNSEMWKEVSVCLYNDTSLKFQQGCGFNTAQLITILDNKQNKRFRFKKIRRVLKERIANRLWRKIIYYKNRR